MRRHKLWFAVLVLAASGLSAQMPESLLIGPGDILHVQVFDTPELEQRARVSDAGELPLIVGGNVQVLHMSPVDAAHLIEQKLTEGHYLLHPRVAVTIEAYATQSVSVLGEVKSPGAHSIDTARSVIDVLTLSGGLTELADRHITIQRHGSDQKIPYFISNDPTVALDTSVLVYPGDTVIVPRAGIVYVLGDVARPGGYTMTDNAAQITVLQLIAHAGGTNHSAVPANAKLIRKSGAGYIEMKMSVSKMQKGQLADLQMQPDDIVYVPFSYLRNFGLQASGLAAAAASAAVYHF